MKKVLITFATVLTLSMNAQEKYSGKMIGVSSKTEFTFSDDVIIVESKKPQMTDTLKVVKTAEHRGVIIYDVLEGTLYPTRYTLYTEKSLAPRTLHFAQKDDFTGVVTAFYYKLTKL